MPVLQTPPRNGKSFKAREIVDVLSSDQPAEAKCTRQPMKVQYNAVFLIEVRVIPLDDLPADGNGRYVNNGQVTHTYTNLSKGKWKKKGNSRLVLKTKNEYHLTIEYHKQGDFRQTISYMTDINGDVINCCQYFNSTTFVVFDHNLFLKTNQLLQERTKILHDQKPCARIRVTKLSYSVLYVMST